MIDDLEDCNLHMICLMLVYIQRYIHPSSTHGSPYIAMIDIKEIMALFIVYFLPAFILAIAAAAVAAKPAIPPVTTNQVSMLLGS